uniref:Uncharacterized protein n=1 Tax=Gorilla gorilla gorilla TaxID=9595 RepID=G3SEJ7_GORGO
HAPAALSGALLGCLCLALLFLGGHWPETVCETVENDCRDPPDYWTIHGLWPDKSEGCNGSWHFNLEEIKDLLPEMKALWPDVIHSFPNRSHFWKHEWEKHGTSAAVVDALNSQKYFSRSRELYRELDSNSVLLKLRLKPSVNYYQVADFKDALVRVYGVIPKIQCLPRSQDGEVQTIGQTELCLTEQVWLADGAAKSRGLRVCEDGPVFYPPPKKKQALIHRDTT